MSQLQGTPLRKEIMFKIIESLSSDDPKMRAAGVVAARHMSRIRPADREVQSVLVKLIDKENPYPEELEAAGHLLHPDEVSFRLLFRHINRPEAISSLGLLLAIEMFASIQSNQVILAHPPPNVGIPH